MVDVITIAQKSGERKKNPRYLKESHKTCRFKCEDQFDDTKRKTICEEYWALQDNARQRDYLLTHMDEKSAVRKQKNAVTHHCQQGVLFRV